MSILEIKKINKTLAKKQVLSDVSLKVQVWEIYGFLWPNGAWKTTTMKCIMWLIQAESWEIEIFGTPNLSQKDKMKIGFMPENTYLYKHLTGEEFLLFNAWFFWYDRETSHKKVNEVLGKVGLSDAKTKYLKAYSKGMLQRIGLAQAIINDPEILFLDEPMSGLDPIGRKQVRDLLLELNKKGTTIFFNTHILADVELICDTISIINHGRICAHNKAVKDIQWSLEDFFIEIVTKN